MPCPRHGQVGRLIQVCERWIYSACLCFALDVQEQERTGFRYLYSVYQVEYSRNLLFRRGSQLEDVFQRMVDRTRGRLTVPQLKTLFGAKRRPHRDRKQSPPRLEVVLETSTYDLTVFKVALRQPDPEGVHQRRVRSPLRGHRA